MLPRYSLRRTASEDGIAWRQPSEQLLAPDDLRQEIGFGRPFLCSHDTTGRPSLMLSVRSESGYSLAELAQSRHGIRRRNILPRSAAGWDSEMVCFGAPCSVADKELLFYNGNQFGRSGFGVAQRPRVPGRTSAVQSLLDSVGTAA